MNGSTLSKELDGERLQTQLERVANLMLDGTERTLREIAAWVGGSEAGVSARLRDLRRPLKDGGKYEWAVKKRRIGDPRSGLWAYSVQKFEFDQQTGQGQLFGEAV